MNLALALRPDAEPVSSPHLARGGPVSESQASPVLPRVALGDEGAVKECLDRYGGLVWSLARRWIRSREEAEDAVQEIFISVWRSAGRFDASRSSEATFVATIARRRLIDRLRAAGTRPQAVPMEDAGVLRDEHSSAARADASLDLARVEEALAGMRPEQRQVLELAVVGGHSHSQIASHTGLALGTVKTHVRRGLIRIRERLEAGGPR